MCSRPRILSLSLCYRSSGTPHVRGAAMGNRFLKTYFLPKNRVYCSDKIWLFVQMFLIWTFSIPLCEITDNTPNYSVEGPVVHLSLCLRPRDILITISKTAVKPLRFLWVYTCMYIYVYSCVHVYMCTWGISCVCICTYECWLIN